MRHTLRRLIIFLVLLTPLAVAPAQAHVGTGIDVDAQGRVYFADTIRNRIWRIEPDGRLTLLATDKHTDRLAVDPDGTVYFAYDYFAGEFKSSYWKVTPDGRASDVPLTTEEERKNLFAKFEHKGLASNGVRYAIRENNIRVLSPEGAESALALRGTDGSLPRPLSFAVDPSGNLFVVDYEHRRIVRIASTGEVTTVARAPWSWWPTGVAVRDENVYVLERRGNYFGASGVLFGFVANLVGNPRVRKITPDGTTTTLATVTGAGQRIVAGALFAALALGVLSWRWRRKKSQTVS